MQWSPTLAWVEIWCNDHGIWHSNSHTIHIALSITNLIPWPFQFSYISGLWERCEESSREYVVLVSSSRCACRGREVCVVISHIQTAIVKVKWLRTDGMDWGRQVWHCIWWTTLSSVYIACTLCVAACNVKAHFSQTVWGIGPKQSQRQS